MSGSGDDSVRISINADSADFSTTMASAMTDAQKFNAILKSVNNDLAKAAAIWDQGAEAITKYASALSGSSNAAQAAREALRTMTSAAVSTEEGFKSAADSASVFVKALSPTPLQALRALMGDALPAAFRMVQTATLGVVEEMTGLNRQFASAAESAAVFVKTLNPSPAAAFRAALNEIAAGNRVVSTTIGAVIEEQTGLNRAFTSAAESARTFMAALSPTPLAAFRAAMAEQIPAGVRLVETTMQEAIAAATGLGAAFKSAAASAEIFQRGLDPTPLMQMRDLMGDKLPEAVVTTTATIGDLIDAMTRENVATKSAAESAEVFAKGLRETIGPLAALRDMMATDLPAGLRQTQSDINELIDGFTRESQASKSAAESARVFAAALGQVQTPLQRVRALMATEVPGAFRITQQATRAVIDELTGVDRAFRSAEDSARAFNQALDPSPLQRTRALMEDAAESAGHAGGRTASLTREFVVLGHEAMVGNYSRIPGTFVVLAENCGMFIDKLGEAVSAMSRFQLLGAAAVIAVAAAFIQLIMRAHEATQAINEAMNAATMRGRDPNEAATTIRTSAKAMQDLGVVSQRESVQIAAAIERLPDAAAGVKDKLQSLGTQFFLNWGDKAGEELEHILASTGSLKSYLDQQHLLIGQQADAWAKATTESERYRIGVAAISARLPSDADIAKRVADAHAAAASVMADIATGGGGAVENVGAVAPAKLGDFQPAQKAESQDTTEQNAAVIELTAHNRELVEVTARRDAAQRALAAAEAAGDSAAAASARQAIDNGNAMIAMWKAQGDASWAQKQEAALNQILLKLASTATNGKKLAEDENRARVAFWEQAAKQAGLTEGQITQALANAAHARLMLTREELAAGAAAAKQSLQEKIAALNAEQAANKDNFAKVNEIEAQKLALLKQYGGEATKAYQDELAKQANMRREQAAEIMRLGEQTLGQQRSQDQAAFQVEKDLGDEAVAERKLTKDQEIADLRAFAANQHAIELQAYNDFLKTIQDQPIAYSEMLNKLTTLKRQWAAQDAKLTREAVAADEAEESKRLAPFENAISGQVSALLRGTETMHQAVAKMAANIVVEYASMAVKAAAKSAAMFAYDVGRTVWAEASKTAATATGTAARGALQSAAAAAETDTIGVRVGKWLASELGLTAATTSGAATRTAAQTTADTTAQTTAAASNVAQGMSYAAVGAAAAGASAAAVPVVGWAMAPGVAATTYGELSGFASMAALAVGAWNLPRDMPANLHAGEMVVPQNFAAGLRAGGGFGGSTSQTLNYAPRISGGGGDMSSALRQQAASFKSYMWHATRNGALNLPHGH